MYTRLAKETEQGNHKNIIEISTNILKISEEEDAFQCKLVSLIRTKQFDQALALIKGKESQYSLQHAYILHRQGKNKEALVAIKKVKSSDIEVKHLQAQIEYKLNQYDKSIEIYTNLITSGALPEDEISEVASNLLACASNQPTKEQEIRASLSKLGNDFEKTYEYFFNEGLVQLS